MIFRAMSVTVKVEVTGWLEMWALNSDLEESHSACVYGRTFSWHLLYTLPPWEWQDPQKLGSVSSESKNKYLSRLEKHI